ncbi:MAG TPA: hypothetical protein VKQ36_12090 [Ktedonobacterales bacterium]|nr:hypothetical protein [Ktedonobacterales bacterium]
MGGVVILLLGSLVFLSAILITMALMMRSRWARMGAKQQAQSGQKKQPTHPTQPTA